jgi:2-polyprenyl-6-methoxyphenol hydroxylase-like FAD-dependent oxidoreductase
MDSLSSTKHHLSGQKILVAGGGIAGLAFAIAIHKHWLSTSSSPAPTLLIYERDSEENAIGREGYSLSIRSDAPGGIQAMQKLGILDAMLDASITNVDAEGGGFCIWDANWEQLIKIRAKSPPGLPVGSLRIARKNLRSVLVRSVEELGCRINWDISCTGITKLESGALRVELSNGAVEECDIVVAADGASSKLRTQLRPEDPLQFQQICCIGGAARFDSAPPEPVNRNWGILMNGSGTSLFASPVSQNTALWSVSYVAAEPRLSMKAPGSASDVAGLINEACERGKGFPPLFSELLDRTDPDSVMAFNAMDKTPFAHTPSDIGLMYPKVIFIGDANHAVSPFAGNGANLALCDGWDLAEQLTKASSVGEGLEAYDSMVVPRSRGVLRQSHISIRAAHSTGWESTLWILFFRLVKLIFYKYIS